MSSYLNVILRLFLLGTILSSSPIHAFAPRSTASRLAPSRADCISITQGYSGVSSTTTSKRIVTTTRLHVAALSPGAFQQHTLHPALGQNGNKVSACPFAFLHNNKSAVGSSQVTSRGATHHRSLLLSIQTKILLAILRFRYALLPWSKNTTAKGPTSHSPELVANLYSQLPIAFRCQRRFGFGWFLQNEQVQDSAATRSDVEMRRIVARYVGEQFAYSLLRGIASDEGSYAVMDGFLKSKGVSLGSLLWFDPKSLRKAWIDTEKYLRGFEHGGEMLMTGFYLTSKAAGKLARYHRNQNISPELYEVAMHEIVGGYENLLSNPSEHQLLWQLAKTPFTRLGVVEI